MEYWPPFFFLFLCYSHGFATLPCLPFSFLVELFFRPAFFPCRAFVRHRGRVFLWPPFSGGVRLLLPFPFSPFLFFFFLLAAFSLRHGRQLLGYFGVGVFFFFSLLCRAGTVPAAPLVVGLTFSSFAVAAVSRTAFGSSSGSLLPLLFVSSAALRVRIFSRLVWTPRRC